MDSTIGYFAVGIVALLLGILFARRKESVAARWHEAFALAQEIVPAIEQLYLTKKIAKEQRLDAVMGELRRHFPELQEHHLRWAVENAVNLMNQGKLIPLVTNEVNDVAGWLQGVRQ